MPIHERTLIRPENVRVQENLVLDGIDVSGHWSTFIEPRVVTDYNERLQDEIAALPGGENIHRCWQCGSCTNACTVNAMIQARTSGEAAEARATSATARPTPLCTST